MFSSNAKKPVIFDHDGGIDDLLSLMLLLTMDTVNVVGVTITPADCYPDDALKSTLKILTLTNNTHIPVAVGNRVGPNPFPPEWRAQPRVCHSMPAMLRVEEQCEGVSELPADQWIEQALLQHTQPVTVLMTGPATNLAHVLQRQPQLTNNIEEVIWMGGAIDVRGNVAMHDHDGSAEWNAYWDPASTKALVASGVNLTLVPLDATNALPVSRDFLQQLAAANTELSDLAGQFWAATVTAIPSYEFTYFLWDVLATTMLTLPADSYKRDCAAVNVSTQTPNAGQISRADDTGNGTVHWISEIDADIVRQYVVKQFSKPFSEFVL